MNKSQLVEQVAERLEMSRKEAAEVVDAVISAITESVAKGEKVAISGFGIFEQVFRQARIGRNPRTGETVKIGAVTMPKFRPGTEFKNIVAGARDAAQRATDTARNLTGTAPDAASAPTAAPAAKKAPAARKAPAKKSTAAAKKAPAKKTATAKKAPAAKKTSAAAKAPAAKKATAAKKTSAKKASAAKPASS